MWQTLVSLIFFVLGLIAVIGAINAYRVSVGTPYYAGVVGLAALPALIFFVAVIFLLWGSVRRRRT